MNVQKWWTAGLCLAVALAAWPALSQEATHGLIGFSGQVRGVVKDTSPAGFSFQVARVLKVWENNRADRPEALAGQTIRIGPRIVEGDGGREVPNRLHIGFIRRLQPGQEITLEVTSPSGRAFQLLELTADQRAWAGSDATDRSSGRASREAAERVRAERAREMARTRVERDRPMDREEDMRLRERDAPPPRSHPEAMEHMERALHEKEMLINVLREELHRAHMEMAEMRRHIEELRRGAGRD